VHRRVRRPKGRRFAARRAVFVATVAGVRSLITLVCAVAAAVLFAGESQAAPITVGSDLTGTVSADNGCEAVSCTRVLVSVNNVEIRSPIDGVVVRWRAIGQGTVRLRLARRDAVGGWSAGPSSDFVAFPVGSERGEWATRVPIAVGDFLGVDAGVRSGVYVAARCNCPDPQFPGTATTAFWLPRLEDGQVRAPFPITVGLEALVNVDIEPDVDRDGFGDDTQDCAPTDPALQVDCGATPPPAPPPQAGSPSPAPAPNPPASAPLPAAPIVAPPTAAPPAVVAPVTAPASPPASPRRAARRCVVPRLRGRTVRAARKVLRARGCRLGAVRRVKARGVRRGRILSQTPRAGRSMRVNTRVRVRVRV
jgi:hypothetical protein